MGHIEREEISTPSRSPGSSGALHRPDGSRVFMTHDSLQSLWTLLCLRESDCSFLKMLLTWGQVSYFLAAWALRGKDLSLASDGQGSAST